MTEQNKHITELILQSSGIDLDKYDDSFLNKSIQKGVTETHCDSVGKYCSFLEQNIDERDYFIDSLQISYSEFFRNSLTFAVLERIILPSLIHNKNSKEIRIWSSACALGQEAYSLAKLFFLHFQLGILFN